MNTENRADNGSNKVKLEISSTVLASLLNSGLLKVAECKCLDANTKRVLWQSLLTTSLSAEQKSCM
ncbi:hypothetical protein [Thalassotalea sp. PLHSN55]|uniref:hypothetical protein n=1 Tax=Thalassotalea sp. PLHSN55 TaxID=3435888 RepID=UPI003F87C1A8